MTKLLVFLLSFLAFFYQALAIQPQQAAIIIFSFDRPLQLYSLLESINIFVKNINQKFVVYRTSDKEYEKAYREVQSAFSHITLIKQSDHPKQDFKPLLLKCFEACSTPYILFAVDDNLVIDYVDIDECITTLEKTNSYGFYLMLGTNVNEQSYQGKISLPPLEKVQNNIFRYQFKQAIGDWNYPHNFEMTIFRKSSIEPLLKNLSYTSPNTLEQNWCWKADSNKFGLIFDTSKIINIPLNLVQQDWHNPSQQSYSTKNLLEKWNQGLSIDITKVYKLNNTCLHVDYVPTFTKRKNNYFNTKKD